MDNKIKSLLCKLNICNEKSIKPYFPKVRDRNDILVLRCEKSGVILLSRSDHIKPSHYENKSNFRYCWDAQDKKEATLIGQADAIRRYESFKNIIINKKWIDIGTGTGGILDLLSPLASDTVAVEPQIKARNTLKEMGYKVYPYISEVPQADFEVATLFHVFEHLAEPIETLRNLKAIMKDGAEIIIEVPHAKDFLIFFLDIKEFKAFTFCSEHLILHTRDSIKTFLEVAGFTNINIQGCQRYPLANHLHWLSRGKPGGHIKWHYLRTNALDNAYEEMLSKLDYTDTLIATAIKS